MAKVKNKISQPTVEDEILLKEIEDNSTDYINVRKRKFGIKWLRPYTIGRFSKVLLKEKDERKVSCKSAAILWLNGFWKLKFLYALVWRWFYYVKQYGDHELLPLIALAKKKIPVEQYYAVTMLLTAMKDTAMQMTREEVNSILRAQSSGASGK